ncbi:conjugal transfer protein TrbL family protein [Ktedonospora formicarum]|uniref:Uncharacterized protein n=1 Tax=Ktedonospora formicarum TaxID=2778364 RepID=A0A8J3MZJ2_9CHLR|nr:conjugal transfer protein TrbL family protein [Ktedonospora formicarum]GHO50840.1 hypothetical protein KSX_90030 [Ktedonospora formicarum]
MDPIAFWDLLQKIFTSPNSLFGTSTLGPLEPLLITYLKSTPENLTAGNPVVIGAWGTMLAVADAFFALFIIVGAIQIMISNSTGTLTIPLSQFVPKIITTALMLNLSYFFCRMVLQLNNVLCGSVNANLDRFFQTINNGARITQGQSLLLYLGILILLNVLLFRLLFEAFDRLVLWNLLFVLSPIAILFSFLPHTSSVFTFWARLFLVVTFTQFVQFLAFALGLALLASFGQNGFDSLLLAIAMLFLVTKIPSLLARFSAMPVQSGQGIGQMIGTIVVGARLLSV